ncbi:hypothetical protein AA313_de0203596 [Arthrobotrys entomopaga]|nr:hypothetical protein AA313_de0203596 [Arthrobotrys entomopaga]
MDYPLSVKHDAYKVLRSIWKPADYININSMRLSTHAFFFSFFLLCSRTNKLGKRLVWGTNAGASPLQNLSFSKLHRQGSSKFKIFLARILQKSHSQNPAVFSTGRF